MERKIKVLFAVGIFIFLTSALIFGRLDRKAHAQDPDHPEAVCTEGVQASGALYRICMPNNIGSWNGDLVVYAHGYVAEGDPLAIPAEAASIGNLTTFLGYGFATTSYSVNGLAVHPAMEDLIDLVMLFASEQGEPDKVYLIGPSEGGLITALSAEQHPEVYDGAMALCGPYGDFQAQVNYLGDFRVVFDYFFPGLMPGSAVDIPPALMADWDNHYATMIRPVISETLTLTPTLITQLMTVTGAPYTSGEPMTQTQGTLEHLLWYNVFTVNNAVDVLGGQPFDNATRAYTGSDDDPALNAGVARFTADAIARDEIQARYQTTGHFTIPVVTMHTTQDEIVPYFHVPLYEAKMRYPSIHTHFPVVRYGHCAFEDQETLTAFAALVELVDNPNFPVFLPVITR
jgi:pimeloyl-ACP methyl ester carboxylesterase